MKIFSEIPNEVPSTKLLDRINYPEDLKELSPPDLKILADELLFGKLKSGGSVKIEFDEESDKIYLKWPKLNGGAGQDTKTSPESIEI